MNILGVIIILAVIGVVLYLVNSMIPMEATIKAILNCFVVICVLVWLLRVFGVWGNGPFHF